MGHCVVGSHKHIPAMVLGFMYPSLCFTWPPKAGLTFVKRVNLAVAVVPFLPCGGTGTIMQFLASLYNPFAFLVTAPVSHLS